MENQKNGLVDWLKCRTVGLCMCFNRLMNFHVVRSTKPCQKTQVTFIGNDEFRVERDLKHIQKYKEYPDNKHFISYTQKFMFRNASLRHLRIEQFTRYFYMAGEQEFAIYTKENTVESQEAAEQNEDGTHRNYDKFASQLPENSHFLAAFKSVPGCKRRHPHRLGVSRIPFIECIGPQRESFYETVPG